MPDVVDPLVETKSGAIIPKEKLAERSITAERMAGTACGGMDQTASIMGSKNNALLIDFKP